MHNTKKICPSCRTIYYTNKMYCGNDGEKLISDSVEIIRIQNMPPPVEIPSQKTTDCQESQDSDSEKPETPVPLKSGLPRALILSIMILSLSVLICVGFILWRDFSHKQELAAVPVSDYSSKPVTEDQTDAQISTALESEVIMSQPEAEAQIPVEPEPVEPVYLSTYEIIASPVTWYDAKATAESMGGHLAVITSEEEFRTIERIAEQTNLKYIWIGGSLDYSSSWGNADCWITGENWTYDHWWPGEPSYRDLDGTEESYLSIWNAKDPNTQKDIGWTMNDQRNGLPYLQGISTEKIGFCVEYETQIN